MLVAVGRAGRLALQTVFPPSCALCRAPLWGGGEAALCPHCYPKIRWIGEPACYRCGAMPGPHAKLGKDCEHCRRRELRITRATAVASYAPPVRELVHALKFHGWRWLAKPLGREMARRIGEAKYPQEFAAVCPVPLHPWRLRERGYNQSQLLAREVAALLGLPLCPALVRRIRNTPSQANLRHEDRLTNPQGAFRVTADLTDQFVLLVDDVLTTGSTVSACAEALRQAGAARVYVVVIAR